MIYSLQITRYEPYHSNVYYSIKRLLDIMWLMLLLCWVLFDQAGSHTIGRKLKLKHKHKHKSKEGDKNDFTDQELGASSAISVCNL